MPGKPQKFVVSLAVNVAVFADDAFEARKKAQGWLQRNVRQDSTVEVNLVIPDETAVPSPQSGHEGWPSKSVWASDDNAGISAERSRPEYVELIDRLTKAETTDDYLRIRQDVLHWKNTADRHHALPLVRIGNLLDTLAEAVRWADSHPSGARLWNLGGLFASLKALVQEEHAALRKWEARRKAD